MTLADALQDETIRQRINDTFTKPAVDFNAELLHEWRTENQMAVRLAYDYLLRFWVEHTAADVRHEGAWVARQAVPTTQRLYPAELPKVKYVLERADTVVEEFIETGEMNQKVVEVAVDLARLDAVHLSKHAPQGLGSYNKAVLVDLAYLFKQLRSSSEMQGNSAVINPTFGSASGLVDGVDADVILDDVLIETSVSDTPTFTDVDWQTLVTYIVLADLHGNDEDRSPWVETLRGAAMYYPRFDRVIKIRADDVYSDPSYGSFREWFFEYTAMEYLDVG